MKVQRVLERLGIVGNMRARRFWAQCPQGEKHESGLDKHPSWMVRIDGARGGQHHCFTCKFGGSLVDLVMKTRDIGFPAARSWIEEVTQGVAEHDPVSKVIWKTLPLHAKTFRLPDEVRFQPLDKWVTGARRYAEQRGITAEQVERFGIGYAVEGRLAGRIVIVTRNTQGHPSNYTGRDFTGAEQRYMNATTEEKPDLGVLFGEHLWPEPYARETVIVTEGALNALAVERALGNDMHGAGAAPDVHVVAEYDVHGTERLAAAELAGLGGSAVHVIHYGKLATFKRVIVLTDPDAAGDACALELQGNLGRHCITTRCRLRNGTDAASLSREELRAELWERLVVGSRG